MFGKTVDYEFAVDGMSCAHCSAKVESTLSAMSGVKRARVDLEKGTVKIKAAAGVELEALKAAVRAAGYGV